ncbi:MAG: T9SS type A sorting domain-containing protein [Dinghuibacter sp.]|nr:T9SS type A sorting domain-containing protein [Dinghuibacter sp.]
MNRKKTLLPVWAVAITGVLVCTIFACSTSRTQPERNPKQDGIDLAILQEISVTKDPATGKVPKDRLMTARAVQQERFRQQSLMRAVPGMQWEERGPNNVGGRTRGLIFDLADATKKKVWAAGVDGGVWRCNDITLATPVWNRIDDFWANMAVTTLAQSPANTNILYAGTGEGWFNIDAVRGLGIWKSTNGGVSWSQLASTSTTPRFNFVQKIVVDGLDTVFACTRDSGLQRSLNGGATWTRVLGQGVNGGLTNRAADVEIGADGTIYCTMGIFSIDGIYRSTNNGTTWTKIYTSASDEPRIEIACAPSNKDTIYALLQDVNGPDNVSGTSDDNRIKKLMRTSNATAAVPTWTTLTTPSWCDQGSASTDFTRNQSWYDLIAAVDPLKASTVYIGGVDILKSINSGTSWTQVSQWASGCAGTQSVHADIHAIVFAPGSSTRMIYGTDGGVYFSDNSGTTITQKNNGYNVTQFYGVAVHPTNTNEFLAGAQDNGSQRFTTAGINSTTMVTGGDGGFAHIDQTTPNTQITSYVFNNWWVSTTGGGPGTWVQRFKNNNGQFINPSDYDNTADILYSGNTAGTYFRWLTPATNGASASVSCTQFAGASVLHVSVAPITANRVYFGLNNGSVVRVDNAHTGASVTGTVIRPAAAGQSVSCVAVDPANEAHILVTYSNYGITSVYETTNANAVTPTWTAVEGNLPDMPVRWAMFDPRNADWALLATELGVWSTDDLNGATTDWQPTNNNLANVRVDHFQYRASDRLIAAATHGRGLFTAKVPADLFIKDQTTDAGVEPNPDPTSVYWNSQSIWVCKTGTTCTSHQNPEFGQTNTVRVQVDNRGGLASIGGGNEVLKVYWAKASSALSWPYPWNGAPPLGCVSFPMGGLIGQQNIPVIPAGGSVILNFSWNTVPNPNNYSCFGADKSHFCLLARIETNTTSPFGMTFPETTNLWQNVKNNNNIAWRNVSVEDIIPRIAPGGVLMYRTGVLVGGSTFSGRRMTNATLRFPIPEEERLDPAFNYANYYVALGKFYDAWAANGAQGDGVEVVFDPDTREPLVHLMKPDAAIFNIPIKPDELNMVVMQTEQFKSVDDGKDRIVHLALHDDNNEPIGGEAFVLTKAVIPVPVDPVKLKKEPVPTTPTEVKVGVNNRTLTVFTNNAAFTRYELNDASGNPVKKGALNSRKQVDASGVTSGVYILNLYDDKRKVHAARKVILP